VALHVSAQKQIDLENKLLSLNLKTIQEFRNKQGERIVIMQVGGNQQ